MEAISKETIIKALSGVLDPDLKKDLVSLGMIENVSISGDKVMFDVVLTTPACPLKEKIKNDCIVAVRQVVGADIAIEVNMTSRVNFPKPVRQNLIPDAKNIIAVASGKGGVGKSTVAANLAVGLGKLGAKVGLLDADIYGPSVPLMFGLKNEKVETVEFAGKLFMLPFQKYGIKVMSIGFIVDSSQALIWRGPMASNALKQLFTDTHWEELDYLVLDLPPGTGDIQLTIVQNLQIAGAIIVSTPQEMAIADARKGIAMFRNQGVEVPVIGIVENMSYFTPEELPDKRYYIFGKDGCKKLSEETGIPVIAELPIIPDITYSCDTGKPVVYEGQGLLSELYLELAKRTAQIIAVNNSNQDNNNE